jgi:hypothetical protein
MGNVVYAGQLNITHRTLLPQCLPSRSGERVVLLSPFLCFKLRVGPQIDLHLPPYYTHVNIELDMSILARN